MKSLIMALSLLCLLSGCAAGLGEDFSCDKVGGVSGCITMDEVRQHIDGFASGESNTPQISAPTHTNVFTLLPRRDRYGQPERTQDVKRKITIFPFVTSEGKHYVDTLDIYFVLSDSQWSGKPVQDIKKD
ncbi:hypothetical protein GCM10007938_42580 [Vibrio zhanjiangensis]|uniref:Type IV conjugative transfer system protein TraV n=1 Tax=Vibrio zhanjiangensis TaxID=1046128 RepID=A0ABQ6F4K9_9VIBR|nr:type IV conjugative transfer system lipoprotein TraV [Vibrio zhanjiangensis]GLT20473.1 hypothetical protein GCM10007938_42580 [Vibrio zhanjiangensis]